MRVAIPEHSLILLIGPSGSGKSSFACWHFRPTEVVSSDACRAMVCDDPNEQAVSGHAFEVLHVVVRKRLHLRRLTVVDATNVRAEDRKALARIAREFDCPLVAIVFDLPEEACLARDRQRPDRHVGPEVIARQRACMARSLPNLEREGFSQCFILGTEEDVDAVTIERIPSPDAGSR